MKPLRSLLCAVTLLADFGVVAADERTPTISSATKDDHGVLVHTVESPYQSGKTSIRVLLPKRVDPDKKLPVLFVLPVEAGNESRYGDGLREVQRAGLHDEHGLICVAPTFSQLPWYADHPTDATIRQESYLLKVVLPFVETTYPAIRRPEGRLLVGFSKSGCGAYSLLLRNPEVFGRAAAWDAPLTMPAPGQFGSRPIFGTPENFAEYQITALLRKRAALFGEPGRLVLTGYGNFREHHVAAHRLMEELDVEHAYRDGPRRKHHWSSGWLPEAVGLLVAE